MTQMGTGQSKRAAIVQEIRHLLTDQENDKVLERLGEISPKLQSDPEILFLKALTLERIGRGHQAIQAAKQSLKKIKRHEPMLVLARCHRQRGDTEESLAWCDRAQELVGENDQITAIRAGALEEAGRFDEASAVIEPVIELHESDGRDLPVGLRMEWSKLLVQKNRLDDAVGMIDETTSRPDILPPAVNHLKHLKAKACDRKKDFQAAWHAAEEANEIGRIEFDPEIYKEQVDTLIENWSKERMEKFPLSTCESELPVFVAGMPRSGTSTHRPDHRRPPQGRGRGRAQHHRALRLQAGQRLRPGEGSARVFRADTTSGSGQRIARDYVKEISNRLAPPGAERVVNKALGNNKLVGLIARLFPNTRVIHAIRDPRDVAISCFMGGFNNRLHPWTTRAEWAPTPGRVAPDDGALEGNARHPHPRRALRKARRGSRNRVPPHHRFPRASSGTMPAASSTKLDAPCARSATTRSTARSTRPRRVVTRTTPAHDRGHRVPPVLALIPRERFRVESGRACDAPGPVAQRSEQATHNRLVPGSNPGGAIWRAIP